MMLHGGRLVARALRAEGVDHVFTLSSESVQYVYDGCIEEGVRVVDVRHEQTAGFAAEGWARVTGQPGVAVLGAGPGITDAVAAFANALRVSVPMVVIAGSSPIATRHAGCRDQLDHLELVRPVTKWAGTVGSVQRVEELVGTAFHVARSGVPGPVFLDIPEDVLATFASDDTVVRPPVRQPMHVPAPSLAAVEEAAAILSRAERPMAVVGSQLRWSRDPEALARFAHGFRLPIFLEGLARGALPPDHPCLFRHSRAEAARQSDAVLLLGVPHRAGLGISETAKVVQVDLDFAEIGRHRAVDVGIPSDSGLALSALAEELAERAPDGWLSTLRVKEDQRLDELRAEVRSDGTPPNPFRVCAEVARYVDEDTIVVGDGDDFVTAGSWTTHVRWPGLWMEPDPLGTVGVGPGYAMAARLARPKSKVVVLFGDGAFGLHAMEWEAMARQGIKVVGIVGNDAAWSRGLRRQRETFGEDRLVATLLSPTRYDRVADACGARGFYAETAEQLGRALEQAFGCEGPALVNVKIGSSALLGGEPRA